MYMSVKILSLDFQWIFIIFTKNPDQRTCET